MLTVNEGTWDRAARVLVGAGLIWIAVAAFEPGPGRTGLMLFALLPLLTGSIGWCPIYSLLKIDTLDRGPKKAR